ncbi:WD repeat-containing protein 25 isoform X1 [Phoenix dactylifera]|uniref:WD repeat-containing protein 25 isoform X1 n=1 Tax=Phoenix dactylifera TaxID=42345 RepID=A0A8B7BZA4_PHODC|nr:WD repeat-containing protein 25 isoform X1 [Phoenix dactylifera]
MDLLFRAYGVASDDEGGEGEGEGKELAAPASKRPRSEGHPPEQGPSPLVAVRHHRPSSGTTEAPLAAGRYVSKRERAILAASSSVSDPSPPFPPTVITSPVVGTLLDSDLPSDILASLKCQKNVHARNKKVPDRLSVALHGHTKAVNSVQWSQSHGHLLASAGMDHTVHVWNVWRRNQQKARVFKFHDAAVKNVRWSPQGLSLLSCGYDCSSRLVDVEKGIETQLFKEDQIVEVIKFHPGESNLFLSGGSKGFLRLWDIRVGMVIQEYLRGLGSILDIEFSADGKHFISSSDTSKSRVSENSIIVWDVSRQVPLSNQVYTEAYTCPCIRYHPSDACFVAQSNGNYIAIFSARAPFKLDRYRRYENHGVWGFPIKCNFSLDGQELASGSSDGCMYFYSYKSSALVRKIKAFEQACIDVAFHPMMPNVIASCSWTGEVSVFE